GDVNGDGYDDLAVGVREWDGPNAGEVDVGG
ncbi:FG-GAP repeat protein, partial [bacterium]|nr:FG-GAP repeat protein [bacterium]